MGLSNSQVLDQGGGGEGEGKWESKRIPSIEALQTASSNQVFAAVPWMRGKERVRVSCEYGWARPRHLCGKMQSCRIERCRASGLEQSVGIAAYNTEAHQEHACVPTTGCTYTRCL